MPDSIPVPEKAIADAESHVLHGITMWLACASTDPNPGDLVKAMRRRMIEDILEAACPAIRADERDRVRHVIKRVESLAAACQGKAIEVAVKAERERAKPLLDAYHELFDTWWNKTATMEITEPGFNGFSYEDTNAMNDAAEAIERLLATGGDHD